VGEEWLLSDGVITIRPPHPGDSATLIAGRDEEWARWLGPGADEPIPTACILVHEAIVGWVDYDPTPNWLAPGEVNIGYYVFAPHRRRGYATRAVLLLMERLASEGKHQVGVLSIRRGNRASQRVAERAGFSLVGELPEELRFARSVDVAGRKVK
jgi:RimJ/RimL family protein N-acetyltransferase